MYLMTAVKISIFDLSSRVVIGSNEQLLTGEPDIILCNSFVDISQKVCSLLVGGLL